MRVSLALAMLLFLLSSVASADNGKCGNYSGGDVFSCTVKTLSWVEVAYFSDKDEGVIGRPSSYLENKLRIYVKKHIPYVTHEYKEYGMYRVLADIEVNNRNLGFYKERALLRCDVGVADSLQVALYIGCEIDSFLNRAEWKRSYIRANVVGVTNQNELLSVIEENLELMVQLMSEQMAEAQIALEATHAHQGQSQ